MQYRLVILFSRLICYIPLKYSRIFGKILCQILWLFVPLKRKRIAVDNVMQALSVDKKEAKRIAKASFVRFGPMFMEVFYMPRLVKEDVRRHVRIEGIENLEKARSLKRGIVTVTAHCGNWEVLGAAMAKYGFPVAAVVQRQSNAGMDRFINEYRTIAGMHVTYRTSVREMVRILDAQQVVALLIDQDSGKMGVFVEFFGRLASTAPGAAALARLKDAPILPAFTTYDKKEDIHVAIIHPPIMVEKTEDRDMDILNTTAQLTHIVEEHIRKYPEEWFWLHKRWKTRPPEEIEANKKEANLN
jgi:KDO2-lipid IV(A) lauroyltransferase